MTFIDRGEILRRLRAATSGAEILQLQGDLQREVAACLRLLTLAAAGRHFGELAEAGAAARMAALPDVLEVAGELPALTVRWLGTDPLAAVFAQARQRLGGDPEAVYLHPRQLAELRAEHRILGYDAAQEELLGFGGTILGACLVSSAMVPGGDLFLARGAGPDLRAARVQVNGVVEWGDAVQK